MNREVKKDLTDFPLLNMSIGEYYKLLMEGRRPTRQRTVKEDQKMTPNAQVSAPALARNSKSIVHHSGNQGTSAALGGGGVTGNGGMGSFRRPGDISGLSRSHSEALPMGQHSGRKLGGGDKGGTSGSLIMQRDKNRSLKNKRKLKIKSKMKFTREDGGLGSAPKVKEEKKQGATSPMAGNNLHLIRRGEGGNDCDGNNEGSSLAALNPGDGGAGSADQQSNALSKLRHREHNPARQNFQKPKKRKQQENGRSAKRAAADDSQGEERKTNSASFLANKFELVEVHLHYAKDRLACDKSSTKDNQYRMRVVTQVKNQGNNYQISLKETDNKDISFNFNNALFASNVYIVDASKVSSVLNKDLLLLSSLNDTKLSQILVTQLVSCDPKEAGDPPRFGAICRGKTATGAADLLVIPITLRDEVNLQSDLIEFGPNEATSFKTQNKEYQADNSSIVEKALVIKEAYDNYFRLTSKISLNKDNLEDFLFSFVQYQSCENQLATTTQAPAINTNQMDEIKAKPSRSGVYLRSKFDSQYYNEHLLFMKKLGGGQQKSSKNTNGLGSHKEVRNEWLQLSKNRVFANVSKGFVSLDCLQFPSNDGSMRLKKRNLHFISYRESMEQRADLRKIASQRILEDQERKAPLLRDSSMRPGDRCVLCNYQAQGIDHLRCSCCNKVFHEQCCLLQPKRLHQLYLGFRETNWRCPDCIRCVNCLCLGGKSQSQQLLVCKCCNTAYHFDCLDPTVKLTIPHILPDSAGVAKHVNVGNPDGTTKAVASITEIDFHCEKCVQCEQCGSREAGKNRQNKWSKDFKLCSNCNKKRKKHQYCKICECLWPDDIVQEANEGMTAVIAPANQLALAPSSSPSSKIQEYLNQNMINCGKCQTWVHFECDRIFEEESIKQRFEAAENGVSGGGYNPFGQELLQYHCQDCRNYERSQLIRQVIENLSKEDKIFIFQEPVENIIANYTKIIKMPMCFNYVRDKAAAAAAKANEGGDGGNQYLTDPAQLRKDISLIFENAMKFNLPKHKVHKEAQRLGEVCSAVLDTIWNRLEQNASRTLDENKHKEWLRQIRTYRLEQGLQARGQKLLRASEESKMEPSRPNYQLKLEELFDQSEFQPTQQNPLDLNIDAHMTQFSDDQESPSRQLLEYDEEDEELDEDEDMDESQEQVALSSMTSPQVRTKSLGGSKNRRPSRPAAAGGRSNFSKRTKKSVENDDKDLVGQKRHAAHQLIEGEILPKTPQFSSKKARYQQQQAQFAQQYSFSSIGQKGANLLQQAFHQVERQNMQSQNVEPHHSNVAFVQAQHTSADNATQAPINYVQQHQQMMMTYYQEMDDDRCYYSNPARCSFDDPHLCFEEMCYLCGSFGNKKDFLSCTLCGESFHTYCLQLMPANSCHINANGGEELNNNNGQMITAEDDKALISKFQPYWKCLNCKFCDICSSATQEAFLLYCDVCDKAFHSFCLNPPLKTIPKCQWKCQECFKCKKCNTNSFFDPVAHYKPGTNQLLESIAQTLTNDFEFSQNFSLCYNCGMNEHKKSFCKICQQGKGQQNQAIKENPDGNEESTVVVAPTALRRGRHGAKQGQNNIVANTGLDKMLKCKSCGYYCHVKCSRLLPFDGQTEGDDVSEDFKCLECLLTGKSINHLIRETCEHYENMHNIIHRQRLLAQLCSQILLEYFPIPDKAPLFIKAFIEQNQDFFKFDPVIQDWLSLLETGVSYLPDDSTAHSDNQVAERKSSQDKIVVDPIAEPNIETKQVEDVAMAPVVVQDKILNAEDIKMKGVEDDIGSSNFKKIDWNLPKIQERIFNMSIPKPNEVKTEAEIAYEKLYSHKEGFLPGKRNLYEALDSSEGYHRFGQRKHFMDPFSDEVQNLLTLPLEENLDEEVDFAQLFAETEFEAVMKVKLRFFEWFKQTLLLIANRNSKKSQQQADTGVQDDATPIQNTGNEDVSHDHVLSSYLGGQDPPSSIIDPNNQLRDQGYFCVEEDAMIDNPQKRLQCIMCKMKGEFTVTGRLIPFQVNQFVHVNCALWSTDVHEIAEGGYLINFFQIWTTRAKFTRCSHCGETGASLYCSSTRSRCMAAYHFPCAYRNKKMAFAPKIGKETICDQCCKNQRGIQAGLPTEYANTKRRFQIAKNQQPWNMTHHMTSLTLQQQSMQTPNIPINGGSTSAADIEKPLFIEKWRPFYFDMFNRVGNLTVLSLRKEINQIIEEYCGTQKNQQVDQFNDFSTIRIYWKYFNSLAEEENKMEDVDAVNSLNEEKPKTYYLYSNNSIKELTNQDLESLIPYVSPRMKEKVNLGLHYMSQKPEKMREISLMRKNVYQDSINQQSFWQKLMHHFQKERARFSLQNIIFSISEFSGKTKYPISIWNRCADGTKNKNFFIRAGEQVLHAQGVQSQAAILDNKDFPRDGSINGQGQLVLGFGNANNTFGAIRKGEVQSYGSGNPAGKLGIPLTIDDIFKRMTKINQMGEHQNPMASIKRVNASKHLHYEAVLHNLGKKMFYKAPPPNAAMFEDPAASSAPAQAKKQNANQGSNSTGATNKGLRKKARQADTVEGQVAGKNTNGGGGDAVVNKESDLPIPMKYRLSKTQPKRVEVGPSKIHRNGLFTHEDLAGNDIVIEYVGEKIRNKVADKREIVYEQKGIGDCYLFRLDKEYIIDATFHGNKARYLNHSCDANCSAKIINVQQQKHIIISANRPIKSGEELTYNYNFDYEADKIECFCGAAGCLGRLN